MNTGDDFKKRILATGLRLWASGDQPTMSAIARELKCHPPRVNYHFKSVYKLREALIYQAIKQGESRVIVQLIGCGDASVADMSARERLAHFKACVSRPDR